ncbi:MAG: SPOR domain-containing protein [Limnohabitans sp.]
MKRTTQQGGTFLGLIIGLALGLAIALGVAVYVTKVSNPFSSKALGGASDANAQDSARNKDWNPNAILQPKAAAPVPGSSESVAAPSNPASAPASSPLRAPAAAADPLGDLAKAQTPLSTPASAATDADPFAYFVQAGAFRTAAEADAQKAKLSLLGLEAKVSEREQGGRVVYRVRMGAYEDKDVADKVKARLDGQGIEAVLVRVQR